VNFTMPLELPPLDGIVMANYQDWLASARHGVQAPARSPSVGW
jgi:hypothetical protein